MKGTYTAEGIKAVANALRVSASLTKILVSGNQLDDAAKQALRSAVEGRAGFQLVL